MDRIVMSVPHMVQEGQLQQFLPSSSIPGCFPGGLSITMVVEHFQNWFHHHGANWKCLLLAQEDIRKAPHFFVKEVQYHRLCTSEGVSWAI